MIDIHTHILPFIDDGCKTEAEAFSLLKEEEDLGVTDIILTPHYQPTTYEKSVSDIKTAFEEFKKKASKITKINLYLGLEIYDDEILKEDDLSSFSLASSDFYLQELPLENSLENISEILYLYKRHKKKIVLAHVERYDIDKKSLTVLKEKAMFQVNASTVVGHGTLKERKRAKWLLKNDLVDFVASDLHYSRFNYLKQAYDFVKRKYGENRAERLFKLNAQEFLLK